eukprot:TRINITY_DN68261_c0_g1_i1.p1 TRINITY_DN68261_c0_g1~~TRINITY_DN68261_c0_g1_i1.p1  ORF type:complete len:273 (+),score=65.58 TRINITY_DN68261_c0_g1_i1:98-916(+)
MANDKFANDDEEDTPQIIDGLPLIEHGTKMKDQGNACFKQKKYNEAVRCYEQGIATLDKADGKPMLRQEVEQMVALKTVLYCNMAQSLLNLELYRRAVESATACLALDEANTKALYRRSLAREALREHAEALKDMMALSDLGGGDLQQDVLKQRIETLQGKKARAEAEAKEAEESDDDADNDLVRLKERFDEIVEKYDLKDDDAASQISDWLTSGEWEVTVKRVSQRWGMSLLEAHDFLGWIAKGLQFKKENAENQAMAEASAPAMSISASA